MSDTMICPAGPYVSGLGKIQTATAYLAPVSKTLSHAGRVRTETAEVMDEGLGFGLDREVSGRVFTYLRNTDTRFRNVTAGIR